MRIGIIGSGALGALYGAFLAKTGYEVHFLMRSDYEMVRQKGLTVHSPLGDFHLDKVNCYNDVHQMPAVDIVFVGLKTTANQLYEELISPLMDHDTRVISAQNGLGNDERLAQLYGPLRVAGVVAFLCSNRTQPGVIDHLDYGHIHLGNYQRLPDETLQRFAEMLISSGVECKIVDDLAEARWKKLVWNVPFNGLSALLDKPVNEIMADPQLRNRCQILMKEVQTAAALWDINIPDDFLKLMMDYTDKMEPYLTSMHLDRRSGQPLETDAIVGEPLKRALEKGKILPEMQKLFEGLKAIG